jgi:Uma2 family endonuclease
MGEAALKVGMTPAEYLAFERTSDEKHEYVGGEVFAMAGARKNHNLIVTNVLAELRAALRERCHVYPSDMKVWIPTRDGYLYPDVTVACDPRFTNEDEDVLENPTLLIEVLSDSTEAYDRGDKFAQYRTLPSLAEYAMISHHERRVDHYTRQPDGTWVLRVFGPDGRIAFRACACEVAMDEAYLNVRWDKARR